MVDVAGQRATRTSVLTAVRDATAEQHRQIEHLPMNVRLMNGDLQSAEYRTILQRLYGFHAPLARRARLSGAPWAARLDERVRDLSADLADLGLTPADLAATPRCRALPVLDTADAALGCGYVIEGSTLGGRVIRRHVLAALGRHDAPPLRFFSGDDDRIALRWRTFCAELDTGARDTGAVCAAAHATFEAMSDWLSDEPQALPPPVGS